MRGDDLSDRLLSFAARALKVAEALPESVSGNHIRRQLLRSSTSPGANYEEARGAESPADFIHKLSVALKELRETRYWLRLIEGAELLEPARLKEITKEVDELCKIVAQSILTAKRKQSKVQKSGA